MTSDNIGVVAIGRNEGERLKACFDSLKGQVSEHSPIVYVDSGSTDDSLNLAREMGGLSVELDPAKPFTAARARNAGLAYLTKHFPTLRYIQFIDGDCELSAGWLSEAYECLEQNDQLAIVCGQRREISPESSLYNQYTDLEWYKPPGEDVSACGGDALIRVEAIQAVGGYNSALICGEAPEMCIRLRRLGWKIRRLDRVMVFHDADMQRFSEWWKRAVRGGWAVSEGFAMYGHAPEKYMAHRYVSGWAWGALLPGLALLASVYTHGWSLLLLLLYPVLALRIFRYCRQINGYAPSESMVYAALCTLSKFAQAVGQLQYWLTRWQRKTPLLIEYKRTAAK